MHQVYVTHKVYEIVVEGRSYFGYTRKTLEERMRQHLSAGLETNTKKVLYNEFRKIWSNDEEYIPFARTVYESDNKVMALLHEMKFIRDADSTVTGLNVTVGGEDGDTHVKHLANEKQVRDVLGLTWQQFIGYCTKNKFNK
tara:strand:- start:14 stop:436 length:423 start_codon:yes stop_codon:yes gene_type:complete